MYLYALVCVFVCEGECQLSANTSGCWRQKAVVRLLEVAVNSWSLQNEAVLVLKAAVCY